MRRSEALALLGSALALIVAGLVWLFGAYGLIGSGVAVAALTLFVFEVREEQRGEPVEVPARTLTRR